MLSECTSLPASNSCVHPSVNAARTTGIPGQELRSALALQADPAATSITILNGRRMTSTAQVRPAVAMDWLLRTLLPTLLTQSRRHSLAAKLKQHAPIESAEALHDRYTMSRLVKTLNSTRADLLDALSIERYWAAKNPPAHAARNANDAADLRAEIFPQLDEITSYVARTVTARGVGALMRTCVDLTVTLSIACLDSAATPRGYARLERAYDEALRSLAARSTPPRVSLGA